MTSVLWKYVTMAGRARKLLKACVRDLGAQVTDVFHNIKSLKAMGKETWVIRLFDGTTKKINRQLKRQILSKYGLREFQQILIVLPVAVSTYVFVAVLQRDFNEFLLLGVLLHRTMTNMAQLQQTFQSFLMCGVYYRSVRDFIADAEIDREQLAEGSAEGRVPLFDKAISLRDIDFSYRGRGPLIAGASLEIPYRQVTALVGPSGAGKTTIANMLCGLHRPKSGVVCLDAVSLWDYDVSLWRGMIGYVAQECILFNGTIYDNIVLDAEGIETADVQYAVVAAGLSDFLSTLPDGSATVVGESGLKMSGGQRQRIAIARAMGHRPQLLILDEATTNLDPETEQKLWATFKSLSEDATIFAISHQKMVGTIADRMYELRDGTVRRICTSSDY